MMTEKTYKDVTEVAKHPLGERKADSATESLMGELSRPRERAKPCLEGQVVQVGYLPSNPSSKQQSQINLNR